LADIEHESSCLYDETPIMTETTGLKENSVEFTIKNTWPTDAVAALSIHFINADGEVQCDTFEDMNGFESTSAIEALCVNGLAEVGIQIYSTGINFISSIKPEELLYDSIIVTASGFGLFHLKIPVLHLFLFKMGKIQNWPNKVSQHKSMFYQYTLYYKYNTAFVCDFIVHN
jgi:hypothetical protein